MAGTNRSLPLDGIRGMALAAPIVVHLGLVGMGNGLWLSIGMFFTLSGFLITTLALREVERTGRLGIRDFYARRIRRLLPASVLVLALIVVAAAVIGWPSMANVRDDVFAALTWRANWAQLDGGGYMEGFVPSLTTHFWSLSLEEQVYLVFPVLVLLSVVIARRGRRSWSPAAWMIVVFGLLTLASWAMLWSSDETATLYLSTWTRLGEATLGCAAAAASHLLPVRTGARRASVLGGLLVVAIAPLWVFAAGDDPTGIRVGVTVATPLTGLLIVTLWRHPDSVVSRVFSLRPAVWLGRRSYGVYLVHLPLFELLAYRLDRDRLPVVWMIGAVAVSILFAGVMFRFVEEPFRTRQVLRRGPTFALGMVVASAMLVVVSLIAASVGSNLIDIPTTAAPPTGPTVSVTLPPTTSPTSDPDGSVPEPPPVPIPPPPTTPGRILVIGDSTAWVDRGAVERSMEPLGWQVEGIHMVGCPLGGDARVMSSVLGGAVAIRELGEEPGCDEWWNVLLPQWLASFDPTLVVLIGGYGLAFETDPSVDDRWCAIATDDPDGRCERYARERINATAARVHQFAPNAHLVITTLVHADPVGPLELPRERIDRLNVLMREEAARDGASIVDLCAWQDDHMDLLADGTHMVDEGVAALTPWIGVELAAVLRGERLAE